MDDASGLSQLFQTSTQNITMHIKNIYDEGELNESRTCKSDLQVQIEGNRTVKRNVKIYNLEMIIAIGYRVKSSVATSFRKWANDVIEECMKNRYVIYNCIAIRSDKTKIIRIIKIQFHFQVEDLAIALIATSDSPGIIKEIESETDGRGYTFDIFHYKNHMF